MTIEPTKFDHDSLIRLEQWPGDTPNLDEMGFQPFTNRPPVPPPSPPRIRHAPHLGNRTHGPAIDDVRERRQELRRSRRQNQRGEGSSNTIVTMMAQGFETLTLGQDPILRRTSDLQQRQLDLA